MENPQLKNGYTPIANEIMEALARTRFNSQESRLIFAILRKTYGFHKKADWIANSQLERMTGINRCHCSNTRKRLLGRKIVTQTGNKIQFNKLYSQWKEIPKQVTLPKQVRMLPKQDAKVPESATTIDNCTEENIKKDISNNNAVNECDIIPPSLEILTSYCSKRNNGKGNGISPEEFFNYYEARGWMLGRSKMKNWCAAMSRWEINTKANKKKKTSKKLAWKI